MTAVSYTPETKLFVILNAASGKKDADDKQKIIAEIFNEAGRAHEIVLVKEPSRIVEMAKATIAKAKAENGAVVVAGGDGTINAVAQAVLGSGCPFGVLPQGTFNYFCRTNGIPLETEDAARALLTARVKPVQIGFVNDRVFLVNASLGLYPQLLEDREVFKETHSRSRFNAFRSGVLTLMRYHRQLRLQIESQGVTEDVKTPTLFVGNNPLQLEQIGIPLATSVETGHLAAIRLKPMGTMAMLGLMLRVVAGRLGDAENVISFSFRRLTVTPKGLSRNRRMKVAIDGEIVWLDTPIVFKVADEPLYTLISDDAEAPA
ncbi:diacylglycerol kinase family protein [Iodidimonas sp. SYSU 1G8]|uniref:diacylglycerol/lipid kinase family protein n=1 Tax=Iodidimonas sp. SYSU 1G8 TaxID=3133967 RepID=UPI0031FE9CB0